jgi:hypothetical protein
MKDNRINSDLEECSSCSEASCNAISRRTISRRKFLGRGALALGAAGATVAATGGLGLFSNSIAAGAGGGTCATVPGTVKHPRGTWGYPSGGLNADECAERAYHSYQVGHCAYAVMDGIMGTLQDVLGSPYTNLDMSSFVFLWGGLNGWGTVCGTIAGAGITSNLIYGVNSVTGLDDGMAISEEMTGYYANTPLPDYEPVTTEYGGTDPAYLPGGAIPQDTPGTPICHISVSKWMNAAGVTDFWSEERNERCARLAAQMTKKTVQLLNAVNDGTYVYGGTGAGAWPAPPGFWPSPGFNNPGFGAYGRPAQENCGDCHGS